MPLQATSGAASYDGFGGGVAAVPTYIEDVFSTYLYTGNGSTQTITNGIDLAGKGGLVWIKDRTTANANSLFDTSRGVNKYLVSSSTGAQTTAFTDTLTAFNAAGFSLGADATTLNVNGSGDNYASWTFRKQPKFFDVVTYTGNGTAGRVLNHNLGSTPGCIIWKQTSASGENWGVYHRSLGLGPGSTGLWLNLTTTGNDLSNRLTAVSSTSVTLGSNAEINGNGASYVMYFFAHNAGGFGLTGTDNVISCGSYTGNGSATGPTVTLGYEPQWVLVKSSTVAGSHWYLMDTMRGMAQTVCNELYANLTAEEITQSKTIIPTATGFDVATTDAYINNNGSTYIYIAIRRGPMKVPTSGTSVFTPVASRSSGLSQSTPIFNAGFPVDTLITGLKAGGGDYWIPRLTVGQMTSSSTAAEASASATYNFGGMLGILSATGDLSNSTVCGWNFRRAPSFFDVVCYTGTGVTNRVLNHNLTVTPEMIIYKTRSLATEEWGVYTASTGIGNVTWLNRVNATSAQAERTLAVSATTITIGNNSEVNGSGATYVAYLFATCAGVSKVGSYTGNGSTQTINCGFTGGARFVLIKRTDSTGDWYVWDTARGIVTANDPHLSLNTTAAEVTTDDTIDTNSTGFVVNQVAATNVNVTSATYIFLAIA